MSIVSVSILGHSPLEKKDLGPLIHALVIPRTELTTVYQKGYLLTYKQTFWGDDYQRPMSKFHVG